MTKHPQGTGSVTAQYSVGNDHGAVLPTSIGFLHDGFAGFYFKTADGHEALLKMTWKSPPAPGQYNLNDPSGTPFHLSVTVDETKLETGTLQVVSFVGGTTARITGSFSLLTQSIAHYGAKMTIDCTAFDIRM